MSTLNKLIRRNSNNSLTLNDYNLFDDIEGIAKLCINLIKYCDESIRKDLSRNIILSGGNTPAFCAVINIL